VIADEEASAGWPIVNVLGSSAEHGPFADFVVAAEGDAFFDRDSRLEPAVVAEHRAGFDRAKRANRHVAAQFGQRANNRGGVDRRHKQFPVIHDSTAGFMLSGLVPGRLLRPGANHRQGFSLRLSAAARVRIDQTWRIMPIPAERVDGKSARRVMRC
jgi:hypothetical protein